MIQRDQRKSRRFLIQLPIIVHWMDENTVGRAEAQTQDVSSGGLRFDLSKAPRARSALEIVMTLPHELTKAGPVRVRCRGRVLRTQPTDSDRVEVVAAIERYEFMRDAESAA
jgi:PilZ domain